MKFTTNFAHNQHSIHTNVNDVRCFKTLSLSFFCFLRTHANSAERSHYAVRNVVTISSSLFAVAYTQWTNEDNERIYSKLQAAHKYSQPSLLTLVCFCINRVYNCIRWPTEIDWKNACGRMRVFTVESGRCKTQIADSQKVQADSELIRNGFRPLFSTKHWSFGWDFPFA